MMQGLRKIRMSAPLSTWAHLTEISCSSPWLNVAGKGRRRELQRLWRLLRQKKPNRKMEPGNEENEEWCCPRRRLATGRSDVQMARRREEHRTAGRRRQKLPKETDGWRCCRTLDPMWAPGKKLSCSRRALGLSPEGAAPAGEGKLR